jgi:replicative DNA helicase
MLADLRDSGSIEQDADVVLFLHQPKPDVEKPVVETEILISKHRGGRVGKRRLSFIRTLTLFRELTHERTPTLKTVNGMNE